MSRFEAIDCQNQFEKVPKNRAEPSLFAMAKLLGEQQHVWAPEGQAWYVGFAKEQVLLAAGHYLKGSPSSRRKRFDLRWIGKVGQ